MNVKLDLKDKEDNNNLSSLRLTNKVVPLTVTTHISDSRIHDKPTEVLENGREGKMILGPYDPRCKSVELWHKEPINILNDFLFFNKHISF